LSPRFQFWFPVDSAWRGEQGALWRGDLYLFRTPKEWFQAAAFFETLNDHWQSKTGFDQSRRLEEMGKRERETSIFSGDGKWAANDVGSAIDPKHAPFSVTSVAVW
jgi:hypothetical protein